MESWDWTKAADGATTTPLWAPVHHSTLTSLLRDNGVFTSVYLEWTLKAPEPTLVLCPALHYMQNKLADFSNSDSLKANCQVLVTAETHALGRSDLALSLFSLCSQTKSQDAPSAAGGGVAAGVTVTAASEKADDKVSTHSDVA